MLRDSGEITSRGQGLLFYKGFLYLGVAIMFLVSMRGRYWIPAVVVITGALVLTLTRGFILSTSIAVLMLLVVQRRKWAVSLALVGIAGAAFMVWNYLPSLNEGISESRDVSNLQRLDDMAYIERHASLTTLLTGEGFGSLINERQNIENTYLWALWKLGIPGLIFWLVPLVLCSYFFIRIPRRGANRLACAYYFGTVLIYIQTSTNPYLNNPIGLSFVMIALSALQTLAREGRSREAVGRDVMQPLPAAIGR